jgi:hypothetical protein
MERGNIWNVSEGMSLFQVLGIEILFDERYLRFSIGANKAETMENKEKIDGFPPLGTMDNH